MSRNPHAPDRAGWALDDMVFVLALSGIVPAIFAAAVFETVSGITTTGSSVNAMDFDKPTNLLFASTSLQWLGGTGENQT